MMRMTAVMYAVVIATLLSGCEEQPEKPPAKQTTPEVTSEQPAARARGLEITLGDHATPALEALVAECHVPSPEELAIISLLSREGAPVEDAAPALGVALPEDDFARDKALHYSKRACSLGQRAGCARAKQLESKRWKPTYPQFVKGCRTGCIDNGKQDLEPGALTGENLVNMCESTCACMTDALVRHPDFVGFEDTNAALGAMKDVNEDTRYLACVEEAAERLVK